MCIFMFTLKYIFFSPGHFGKAKELHNVDLFSGKGAIHSAFRQNLIYFLTALPSRFDWAVYQNLKAQHSCHTVYVQRPQLSWPKDEVVSPLWFQTPMNTIVSAVFEGIFIHKLIAEETVWCGDIWDVRRYLGSAGPLGIHMSLLKRSST